MEIICPLASVKSTKKDLEENQYLPKGPAINTSSHVSHMVSVIQGTSLSGACLAPPKIKKTREEKGPIMLVPEVGTK